MPKNTLESRILELAVSRGLLTEDQISHCPQQPSYDPAAASRWGITVAQLLACGQIQVDQVRELEQAACAIAASHTARLEHGSEDVTLDSSDADATLDSSDIEATIGTATGGEQPPRSGRDSHSPDDEPTQAEQIGDWRALGLGFASWDRYEPRGLLGKGGMGMVVRAWDPALQRNVALKFLRSSDRRQVSRLLREAQTQAKVHHPNVCTVHEVGTVHDEPYIAMALIDGLPLHLVRERMTVLQRVEVMIQVCEAVHAAHRVGLVHRDLKPANVMVEMDPDGRWVPYVLDFGLAESVDQAALADRRTLVGTPAYFAPEQAGGIDAALSERTDVYALGATLYEMLVGQPPFSGRSVTDVIRKVATEAPLPPRHHDPSIAHDLEAIVLKATRRDPDERYLSARELAADLRRWLAGDPVHAVPDTFSYRTRKLLRKHRLVAAVVTLAVLAVVVAGALTVNSRLRAREQSRIAHQLGIEISAVEQAMQQEYLLPLHNINPARDQLRVRLHRIEQEMVQPGSLATGPALLALGQGFLALDDVDEARERLERAWNDGYQTTEVAYQLARALGLVYRREMSRSEQIEPASLRAAEQKRLQVDLRDRALQLFRNAGERAGEQGTIANASIALYEQRWDDALETAESIERTDAASLSSKARIVAFAHLGRIHQMRTDGHLVDASPWLVKAREAIEQQLEVRRSDPLLYELLALSWISEMEIAAQSGGAPDEPFRKAEAAVSAALTADPQMSTIHRVLAHANLVLGTHQARHGVDPRPALRRSVAAAERAIDLAEDHADADSHNFAGLALTNIARVEMAIGEDPSVSLDQADAHLRQAFDIATGNQDTSSILLNQGIVSVLRGSASRRAGRDPVPWYRQAIASYRAVLDRNPTFAQAWLDLGNALTLLCEAPQTTDSDVGRFLEEAIEAFRLAIQHNPNLFPTYSNLAQAYWGRYEWSRAHGRDDESSLHEAIRCLKTALEISPGYVNAHYNLGNIRWLLANDLRARGRDPRSMLEQARESFATTVELSARFHFAQAYIASLHRIEAQYLLETGEDPEPALQAAESTVEALMTTSPEIPEAHAEQIEIPLVRVHYATITGDDAQRALSTAKRAAEAAPDDPSVELKLARAKLHRWTAQLLEAGSPQRRHEIERGLELTTQLLDEEPLTAASALALQGALHILAADESPEGEAAVELRQLGEKELSEALLQAPWMRGEFVGLVEAVGASRDSDTD